MENSFKQKHKNEKSSFNNINKRYKTELINYILDLKGNNTDYILKWLLNRTNQNLILNSAAGFVI